MKFNTLLLMSALLVLTILPGCEKDDDSSPTNPGTYTPTDSVWSDGSDGWFARLNASGNSAYRYFNLTTRQVADLTDAQAQSSGDWSLAFKGVSGKLNGGASGPGGISAVCLATIGHPDSLDYDSITAAPAVNPNDWQTDRIDYAVSDWWIYNMATHQITPNRNLYVLITASGKYAKILVDSIKGDHSNQFTIKYVYQSDGSRNLSGAAQFSDLDASTGLAYFSFEQNSQVNIANPATSTGWDFVIDIRNFRVDGYLFKLNSAISGPGGAAAYPIYQEINDFDAVTSAPATQIGQGYFQDAFGSIFGFPTVPGSQWYNYNPQIHEITSKRFVYLLKMNNNKIFKMQIVNYYLVVSGQPQSKWVTLRFKEIG